MNKKILPVSMPYNATWTWHADINAILNHYPCTFDWNYCNYIQIWSRFEQYDRADLKCLHLDFNIFSNSSSFYECPWLETEAFRRETVGEICNFQYIDYFIECLKNDSYIFCVVDESKFLSTGQEEFLHDLFIYGYDLDEKIFYVADFTFENKYSFTTLTFNQVFTAFSGVNPQKDYIFNTRIAFVKIKYLPKVSYAFDADFVRLQIKSYLDSTEDLAYKSRVNDTCKRNYGMSVYKDYFKYLNALMDGSQDYHLDRRPFHFLFVHKLMMQQRIQFMVDKGYLNDENHFIEDCKKITDAAKVISNTFIKYTITGRQSTLQSIIDRLCCLQNLENTCLSRILEIL